MRSGELSKNAKWRRRFTGLGSGLGVWVAHELWLEMQLHRLVHCGVGHASAAIIAIFLLSVETENSFLLFSRTLAILSWQEVACHYKCLMPSCFVEQDEITGNGLAQAIGEILVK